MTSTGKDHDWPVEVDRTPVSRYAAKVHEGPLIETQRLTVHGSGTYVELRQQRSVHGLTYSIEFGDVRWGHRGTWGRSGAHEAIKCFLAAATDQHNATKESQ